MPWSSHIDSDDEFEVEKVDKFSSNDDSDLYNTISKYILLMTKHNVNTTIKMKIKY